jgi:hypothetical protein
MGRRRMHIEYWWESQKEREHWEGQDVGEWTIVKQILEREEGMVWIGLIWFRRVCVKRVMNIRVP